MVAAAARIVILIVVLLLLKEAPLARLDLAAAAAFAATAK
jgi:hypothetical protein